MPVNNNLSEIESFIQNNNEFLLLGHENIDGDCLGSLQGLAYILAEMDKDITIGYYQALPDILQFAVAEDLRFSLIEDEIPDISQVIVLDSSGIDRLGPAVDISQQAEILNIDHHEDNNFYGDLNYISPAAAATGTIIYNLAREFNWPITDRAAQNLVLAIVSDTGFFRYSNTDAQTLATVKELMELGADLHKINRALYSQNKPERMRLLGRTLSKLEIIAARKVACLYIDEEDYQQTGTTPQDNEGFVNYARDIADVEVGILFSRENNQVKVSFRSNNYVKVNEIAAEFGGGGHPRAAGCKITGGLTEVSKKVIAEVKNHV